MQAKIRTAAKRRRRTNPSNDIVVFEQLRDEVAAFSDTLEELVKHRRWLGYKTAREIRDTVDSVRERLARKDPAVAVVGEKKAGKSTFLNAVLGARVLGTAVRECTGTVTRICNAKKPGYLAVFHDGSTEEFVDVEGRKLRGIFGKIRKLEKELSEPATTSLHVCVLNNEEDFRELASKAEQDLSNAISARKTAEKALLNARQVPTTQHTVANAKADLVEAARNESVARLHSLRVQTVQLDRDRLARYIDEIHDLTDVNKRGSDVVELTIEFPAMHLPDGITILDTPGVNTDNDDNEQRAWAAIRDSADGCILVSGLNQVMSSSTRAFLQNVREYIPHVLLVLTKVDQSLEDAEDDDDESNAVAEVEEARRKGVQVFAKEVGRSPDEVFSIAVASEMVLNHDKTDKYRLAERFATDTAKLFDQLRKERSLVLGARAAVAIRSLVPRINHAQKQAERLYREQIEKLEAQRLPDPERFAAEQLRQIKREIKAWAKEIIQTACEFVQKSLAKLATKWTAKILAYDNKSALKRASETFNERLEQQIRSLMAKLHKAMAHWSVQAFDELKVPLLQELRKRYRIVERMGRRRMSAQRASQEFQDLLHRSMDLDIDSDDLATTFENEKLLQSGGGIVARSALGTIVSPWFGTALEGVVGALVELFKSVDSLKSDFINAVDGTLEQVESSLVEQLLKRRSHVQKAIEKQLAAYLDDAINRFQSRINSVIKSEKQVIARQRRQLAELLETRDKLKNHEKELQRLQKAALEQSRGLCA